MRTNDLNATLFRLSGQRARWGWGRYHPVLRTYNLWSPICRVPCGVAVDPGDVYSIRGLRINPSPPFMLPSTGLVALSVDVGHTGPRVGGVLLTVFGGIATTVGIVFASVGAGVSQSASSNTGASMLTAGGTLLGIGGTMLISGIVVLVLTRTTVTTAEGYRLTVNDRGPRLGLSLSGAGLAF
jgi:hypothetical protein